MSKQELIDQIENLKTNNDIETLNPALAQIEMDLGEGRNVGVLSSEDEEELITQLTSILSNHELVGDFLIERDECDPIITINNL